MDLLSRGNLFISYDESIAIPKETDAYNSWIYPSEVDRIIEGLRQYKSLFSDKDIDKKNESIKREIHEHYKDLKEQSIREKGCKAGYVYLFGCADKYKIGYSNDVERRLKQLDTRPFKLMNLYSYYSIRAFQIEQAIHNRLSDYKVEGEWYQFPFEFTVSDFDDFVKKVEKSITGEIGDIYGG